MAWNASVDLLIVFLQTLPVARWPVVVIVLRYVEAQGQSASINMRLIIPQRLYRPSWLVASPTTQGEYGNILDLDHGKPNKMLCSNTEMPQIFNPVCRLGLYDIEYYDDRKLPGSMSPDLLLGSTCHSIKSTLVEVRGSSTHSMLQTNFGTFVALLIGGVTGCREYSTKSAVFAATISSKVLLTIHWQLALQRVAATVEVNLIVEALLQW